MRRMFSKKQIEEMIDAKPSQQALKKEDIGSEWQDPAMVLTFPKGIMPTTISFFHNSNEVIAYFDPSNLNSFVILNSQPYSVDIAEFGEQIVLEITEDQGADLTSMEWNFILYEYMA